MAEKKDDLSLNLSYVMLQTSSFYRIFKSIQFTLCLFVLWQKQGKFQRTVKDFFRWQEVARVCASEIKSHR